MFFAAQRQMAAIEADRRRCAKPSRRQIFNCTMYIRRDIESALLRVAGEFPAIAVSGPRRSGKSTLLERLFGETHAVHSLADPLTREAVITDPRSFIETMGERVILEEIQYVPEFTSYIKMLIDEKRHVKGRFIITSPQQFTMIKDLGDSLAGRVALLDVLPFGIEEKKRIPELGDEFQHTKQRFVHACLRGSFPELAIHPSMDAGDWYGSYFQTFLEREILGMRNIADIRTFQRFIRLLAVRCSQTPNYSSMSDELGVSINTIKSWISLLWATQMIFVLPPYYRSLGKRITRKPKIYFLDTGFVSYLLGIKTEAHLVNGPMAGAIFENFVIQEAVKAFCSRGVMPRMYYVRAHNELEIDLLLDENLRIHPFVIRLTSTPNARMATSIARYRKVFSELDVGTGHIISLCDESYPLTDRLSVISLDSFLQEYPRW